MPTETYIALATLTVTGAATTSVTFSSIPSTYRDLIIVANGSPHDNSYPSIVATINSDGGNNYFYVRGHGNGSTAGSGAAGSQNVAPLATAFGAGPSTNSTFSLVADILEYSATNKHKTITTRNSVPDAGTECHITRWASLNAIHTFTLKTNTTAKFAIGSTISLYGVIA